MSKLGAGDPNRLLYVLTLDRGGIARYAQEQSLALARSGIEVRMLAPPAYEGRDHPRLRIDRRDWFADRTDRSRPLRAAAIVASRGRVAAWIANQAREWSARSVLESSFSEVLAPLWAPAFRRLARRGVRFGTVVHDPIRDRVIGPLAWHRRSIDEAYSYVSEAFVHGDVKVDVDTPPPGLTTTTIPHGVFTAPPPRRDRDTVRLRYDLPREAFVLLAFGGIRDGKNLDLAIRALHSAPQAWLLVVGAPQSSAQRPVSFYRELAQSLGVDSRCRFDERYVPEDEVADLFMASDAAVMTYSRSFHSASGVLNVAASHRTPCIASGGPGALEQALARYPIGLWAAPDDVGAIAAAMNRLVERRDAFEWSDYLRDHSWDENARRVGARMVRSTASVK